MSGSTHVLAGTAWRASWIWAQDAPAGRHVVRLHASVDLDRVPEAAPARWCAVSRCVLHVNGVEVGRGPVRSNPRHQPQDDADLAPFLRPGRNHVSVLVVSYAGATPWYLPMPPFASELAKGAFVLEADLGGGRWFVTDERWTAAVLDGWDATAGTGVSGRGVETVDARSLPASWEEVDAPRAALVRPAVAVGEAGRTQPPSYPIGPFGPRPIAFAGADVVPFTEVDGSWTHHRIVAGTVRVDVEGPAGRGVTVTVAERAADGVPVPDEHDAAVRFVCDGSRRKIESIDRYGGQGATIEADEGVTVHAVAIVERLHPVVGAARFSCDDPLLDRIWEVGRRTVTLNSVDAYTDCPTREQRAWTGDFVVHQMVDLTTNEDWRLARWNVHLAAGSQRSDGMLPMAVAGDAEEADFTVIPDWALHWVHAVWNLYRYVGDGDEISELLPVAERVLRWFEPFLGPDGLLRDVIGWVIIDWSSVHVDGASSVLNALWGRALIEFAEMAEWVGDRGRATWARRRHDALRHGFEAFWDPERRRYRDCSERDTASEHAQAAAIVGAVAPTVRHGRLAELLLTDRDKVHATFSVPDGPAPPNAEAPVGGAYLRRGHPEPWWDVDDLVVAQPFFSHVVHDALAISGRGDAVADRCRRWEVALERCDTSWTETWFGGTISHGWSSTPTRDLVQYVLGVRPNAPGFSEAVVDPEPGDLEWIEGAAPTPRGLLHVRVVHDAVRVDSPIPFVYAGERRDPGAWEFPR